MTLTAQQARELSRQFTILSEAMQERWFKEFDELSFEERHRLEFGAAKLSAFADELTTDAVGLTLAESEASIQAIVESTRRTEEAVKTLHNHKRVAIAVDSILRLADAISRSDIVAFNNSVRTLHDLSLVEH